MNIQAAVDDLDRTRFWVAWAAVLVVCTLAYKLSGSQSAFPEAMVHPMHEPIDAFADWLPGAFAWLLRPVSEFIRSCLKQTDAFFLWLPWPIILLAVFFMTHWVGGLRLSLFCAGSLMFMGMIGLWDVSIVTVTIMTFSVIVTVMVGLPIGILASRSDRLELVLRPVLDAMQTLPTFVYLIPVMLLFGIGATSAVIATIVYAVPPVIRLTNLGIRQVSEEALEVARSYGTSRRQMLFKIQLPLARPTIMLGVNQTVMMALAMVVFVALIGGTGLGKEIWSAMRRLQIGRALEGGLAVVLLAMVLDRIGYALSSQTPGGDGRSTPARFGMSAVLSQLVSAVLTACRQLGVIMTQVVASVVAPVGAVFGRQGGVRLKALLRSHSFLVGSLICLTLLLVLDVYLFELSDFPKEWRLDMRKPIDDSAKWMNRNLAFITGPIRDGIYIYGLGPTREVLGWLPWPVLVFGIAGIAWRIAGWHIAALAVLSFGFIGMVGMWAPTMITVSQLIVSLTLSILIAVPLGIIAASSDLADRMLRPVLDTMQTLPAFVYFPVVIMLFRVGELSGIIATVIYAIPPAVRLTNLGIRQVPAEAVEAARSYGSTRWQILTKVQIPMALPSVMMGINQTTMMAIAMVAYAALIGAQGLGQQVLYAIGQFDVGKGFEAGMSIVLLAVVADRITQAWARRQAEGMGISIAQ